MPREMPGIMLRRRLLLDSTMMASWRLKFANRTGQLSLAKRVPAAVGKTAAAERFALPCRVVPLLFAFGGDQRRMLT